MKVTYAAIFRKDQEDPTWYNVFIPDVFGAVTCGKGLEDAVLMAEDLLNLLKTQSPKSFFPPLSIEDTREGYPHDLVLPIDIEITQFDPLPEAIKRTNYKRFTKKEFYDFDEKNYEVVGSLVNPYTSRIFLVDEKHYRIDEIKDVERKRYLLMIFRSIYFENLTK